MLPQLIPLSKGFPAWHVVAVTVNANSTNSGVIKFDASYPTIILEWSATSNQDTGITSSNSNPFNAKFTIRNTITTPKNVNLDDGAIPQRQFSVPYNAGMPLAPKLVLPPQSVWTTTIADLSGSTNIVTLVLRVIKISDLQFFGLSPADVLI